MSAQIIHLPSRFDPLSEDAERRYDRVVHRLNQLSAERSRTGRLIDELERQFVENDLTAVSGRRRGRPLTIHGRRRRLGELLALSQELSRIDEERDRLGRELAGMNRAIERWARETYGMAGTELGLDPRSSSPNS